MADINFEHIDPYVNGQGDNGLTSRQKLRRNFEKIKAWMDSVATMLSGKYLSKEDDDEAEGVITFKKGSLFGPLGAWGWVKQTVENRVGEGWAWFKNLLADTLEALSALIKGNLTVHGGDLTVEEDELGNGGDASIDGDLDVGGLATIFRAVIQQLLAGNLTVTQTATIANLIVTGAAHFFKVIIDEIKAAGGSWIITPADPFTVDLVEDITINGVPGKRLLWRATDGERKRANKWQAGDQALCKTDNLAKGASYNVSNKYYWSLVAAVSSSPVQRLFNGVAADCHYIDIYCGSGETQDNIPTDGNDVPLWHYAGDPRDAAAGDSVAMLGHRGNDIPRQSAFYIAAYSSIDAGVTAPVFASYEGIKTFDLAQYRKTYKDANGASFYGRFFSTATDSDNPTDIEDMLTGSELKIIYGEGSPLVTQPEQHWTQADRQTYVDRCFYYDISMEPALDGGRFWKWTMQAGEESPTFSWEHVTDGDTLAALEKIADVASDSKLTGGGEKTRVLLNWKDSREYYTQTIAATPVEMTTSAESCMGSTFAAIYQAAQTAWTALCRYLNGDQAFDGGLQDAPLWISATLDANRVKKEAAADPTKWKACLLTTTVLPTLSEVQGETAADSYRRKWSAFYEAMATLAAAQLKWQEKKIDEMGDDGFLDPEEKASLRQIFSAELQRYFRMLDDFNSLGGTSAHYDDTHTLSNIVIAHLNNLGTYLDGEQLVYMTTTVAQGGNPSLLCLFEYDSETGGYKPTEDISVVSGKTYYKPEVDEITWEVNSEMREGLTDEMFYPASMESGDRTGYPRWLLKENETQSQVVEDKEWDYFWNKYWSAANTMEANLAKAHQKAVDEAVDELQTQIFIQATAPTNYKAGDHWYQPTTLKNPVTGANVSQDSNGNPIYNHYIAVVENNTLKWKLVNAATTSVFSQLANQIYQAVFDSTNASSLVMRANSIESTVSKISEGSQNLLINSHFEYGTDHWAAYNSATISVVEQSGLPGIFAHCLKVQTSSGAIRGMQFSTTQQPYILLEEGKTYTFSFWAKADASKRIYVYRGTSNLGFFTIGTDWDRYGYSIEGDGKSLTFYVRDNNASDAVTFYLVGLQLECGSRSDWQDFGGEPVMMKSQILQLADRISMGVFKDEARKAGIDIEYDAQTDSGTVTLDGDKVIVEGDLDVKGLTTENVTIVERNHSVPTIINMGIVSENDNNPVKIKSVQVRAVNIAGTAGATGVAETEYGGDFSHMVVLPFYDSLVGSGSGWPASDDNLISFNTSGMQSSNPLYGNFALHADTNVDPSQRRVVQWKQNGTHLTITNEVDYYCQNFKEIENGGYDNNARSAISRYLLNRAVLVVADPRIVCQQNTVYVQGRTTEPYIGGYRVYAHRGNTAQGNDIKGHAGCLSCGGYNARFCVLLPGQTLKLRSQLMTLENHTVLTWVVENPTDFDVMYHAASSQDRRRMTLCFSRGCTTDNDVVGIYANNVAFDPYATPEAVKDAIIGSKEANYYDNNSYYCLDF
ncbi:MAG: carbohydrate binding domain-containing protein [Prevotella sp.]|nr:carbohydrate binding domain-containing protein [Prevotella sp.]MBR0527252.1 carbohydrate binding domain-containing protein [Prevotella sp.]